MWFLRHTVWVGFVELLAVVAGSGCDGRPEIGPAAPGPPTLVWDLSKDVHPQRVGWPERVKGTNHFVESPATIHLTLPSGEATELDIRSAILFREEDQPDRLRSLYFFFEPEGSKEALARALLFCEEYGIKDVQPLHKWANNPRIDLGDKQGQTWIRVDRPEGTREDCFVEIRQAYNPRAPWQVRVCFGVKTAS